MKKEILDLKLFSQKVFKVPTFVVLSFRQLFAKAWVLKVLLTLKIVWMVKNLSFLASSLWIYFILAKNFLARLNILADSGFSKRIFAMTILASAQWHTQILWHDFWKSWFGKNLKEKQCKVMTSKNSSKKTRGLFFWGVIREKVSAFTLIYLFDMPNKQLLLRFFSDYYHGLTLSVSKIILRPIKIFLRLKVSHATIQSDDFIAEFLTFILQMTPWHAIFHFWLCHDKKHNFR